MPQSFTATTGPLAAPAAESPNTRRPILVTGAAGNIGKYFAEHAHERYDLRLMVHKPEEAEALKGFGQVMTGDITDLDQMKKACQGIDTVLHMAGDPSPNAVWDSLLQANIIGTYNTLVAAKASGCRRVIYASSIHAVSGYPADVQVKSSDPVNPGDLYGVSKCFGEALCRYMAEKENLSCIALRIGAFQPIESAQGEGGLDMLDAFVSQRDMQQLIEKCIDVGELKFGIFNGLSNNRFKRLDISDARELLGYAPVDDATALNEQLKSLNLADRVAAHSVLDARQKSGIRNDVK